MERRGTAKRVSFAPNPVINDNIYIKGVNFKLFTFCRIAFSFCILADVLWYFYSFQNRSAYFKDLGVPVWFIYLIVLSYSFFGIRILLNQHLEGSCLGMVASYAVVAFIVHHPVGSGGIGDYPKQMHSEVNFKQIASYIGLIGGTCVMLGFPDMIKRKKIMQGSSSYAIVLGRALISLHFILPVIWFKMYYFNQFNKQLHLVGRNPLVYNFFVGIIEIFASYFSWFGFTGLQKKLGSLTLAVLTAVLTIFEEASYSAVTGFHPMKIEAMIHYCIVQTGIILGCLMLYSVADVEAQPYKKAAD